jgi:YVTN family beta-propeller protein
MIPTLSVCSNALALRRLIVLLIASLTLQAGAALPDATGFSSPRAPVASPEKTRTENPAAPVKVPARDDALKGELPDFAATGHSIHPAGTSIRVKGRIMDMVLAQQGKFLVVKTQTHLNVVDSNTFQIIEQVPFPKEPQGKPDQGSMHGIAVGPGGTTLYFTGNLRNLYPATLDEAGHLTFKPAIPLIPNGKTANPLGVAITPDGKRAIVALSLTHEVVVIDLATSEVISRIPVGICPYAVVLTRDGKTAFVSQFGGSLPRVGDKTEKSAGAEVAVDDRSVALRGSVAVIQLKRSAVVAEIITGIHPEAMTLTPDGKQLLVVDSSGDGISVIDVATRKRIKQLGTKPEASLPYGSLTNGIACGNGSVFAVNAGNNAVAMIDPAKPQAPFAFLAAGGFPSALCVRGNELFVGNIYGYQGNLQKIILPTDPIELAKMTEVARQGFRFPEILRAQARALTGAAPKPVPDRVGEPSPIKHVVYIIKENKKFDPVLGDIGRGNAEPKFCEFPRETTPNTHAIVDEFVLLDNYYCSGVRSSDGHQWTVQGLTTPYREKDWSNARSPYNFGLDPLSYAGCGFIWDHLLRKGLSFRNFGELGIVTSKTRPVWSDYYTAWSTQTAGPEFTSSYEIETLRRYSDMRFPGWEMAIPDQVRADVFLKALAEFEASGSLPDFTILYLPNDHTVAGRKNWPTPRACVADNDLALGRVLDGLSHSRFWNDMAVFAIQDDPQTGVDHVDGQRSLCLIASPYAKRKGQVINRFYNQSSVLHTICRIFGVEPMNQLVAMAPVMTECFQDTPDPSPYTCLIPNVPLNETNPDPSKAPTQSQAQLAPQTLHMDFSKPDCIDEDALVFSRWTWSTVRGDEPFPEAFFGPHGKGLKALGLRLDPNVVADADD